MKKTALAAALMLLLSACSEAVMPSEAPVSREEKESSLTLIEENVTKTKEESALCMLLQSAKMLDLMEQGDNMMLSPLSLYSALGMTMNGADGETLSQMEETLGMTVEELNAFCAQLKNSDELKTANSIWYPEDGAAPQAQFEERVRTDYRGEVFGCDFTDAATVDKVNNWVSENTDKMIPKLVDEIPYDTAMMLINTTLFDGKWVMPYEEYQIHEETFTLADGTEKTTELMSSGEGVYLENEAATGFVKYYENGYRFVAVLPREKGDFTMESLSLDTLLASWKNHKVIAKLPSFGFETSMQFVEIFEQMGMTDAFGSGADFSRLLEGEQDLFISSILQKAKIDLTASGTKAAAATVVTVKATGAAPKQEDPPKEVILDRPFAFMILDPHGVPLFLGKMMDPTV